MSVELPAIWGCPEDALREVPTVDLHPKDHQRYIQTLEGIATGGYWTEIATSGGFTHAEMAKFAARSKILRTLFATARSLGDETRQLLREDAADRRAIDGVDEEVYAANGNFAGTRKKYSDSLLATQLKAGNPKRYSDIKVGLTSGVTLQVNFGIEREKPAIEGEVVEAESKA